MTHTTLVQDFIAQVWNLQMLDNMQQFLHPEFKDYSLPPALPQNAEGTKQWIINTGISFEHHTVIEEQISEADKCVIKIKMELMHVGSWRDIAPTGVKVLANGYRLFKFKDGKIIEHWALIDGQAIENALTEAAHGCKLVR